MTASRQNNTPPRGGSWRNASGRKHSVCRTSNADRIASGRTNNADRTNNAAKRKGADRSRERRKNAVSRRASRERTVSGRNRSQ